MDDEKTTVFPFLLYSVVVSTLIFLLIPLRLITSNPDDFINFSFSEYFFYGALLTFIFSIIICLGFKAISFLSAAISRKLLTAAFAYLVICGFYVSIRQGLVNGVSIPAVSYVHFFLISSAVILVALWFEKKLRTLSWLALVGGICAILIGMPALKAENILDIAPNEFFNVSVDQNNIFLISFDALQADAVATVLDANPELKKELEGFIHFDHVTSVATNTKISTLTTKLGYLPSNEIDNVAFVKKHSVDFITQMLHRLNYQVSTYGLFMVGETDKIINVPQQKITPENINTFTVALTASLQKYMPIALHYLTAKFNALIYFIDSVTRGAHLNNQIYEMAARDPHPLSTLLKLDIVHFDYYVNHLKSSAGKQTAHFHHYVFTHSPVNFDATCTYRNIRDVPQNSASILEETECGLRKFVAFLKKLKTLNAYDNSFIIFASDHGYECQYDDRFKKYKVSEEWCLPRYTPFLMIKPYQARSPLVSNAFESSLIDIPKTLCETAVKDPKACHVYTGVNLLNIRPSDALAKRDLLIPNDAFLRREYEYNDFHKVDIKRNQTIIDYFETNYDSRVDACKNSSIYRSQLGMGNCGIRNIS